MNTLKVRYLLTIKNMDGSASDEIRSIINFYILSKQEGKRKRIFFSSCQGKKFSQYCAVRTIHDYPRGLRQCGAQRRRFLSPSIFLLPFPSKPVRRERTLCHDRACEPQKGRDIFVVQQVGWHGCGFVRFQVRPTWRCCRFWSRHQAALPNTRDWTWSGWYPHFVSRLRLVGTVRIHLGAAESFLSPQEAPFTAAFLHVAHGLGRLSST